MTRQLTPSKDLPSPTEGDDEPFTVTFRDQATGDPLDITGWTASLTIAEQGADGAAVIEKDNTAHTDATGGTTSFDLTNGETSGLAGTYRYDVQVKKSDGSIKTAVIGTIAFTDGVTDREV